MLFKRVLVENKENLDRTRFHVLGGFQLLLKTDEATANRVMEAPESLTLTEGWLVHFHFHFSQLMEIVHLWRTQRTPSCLQWFFKELVPPEA